MSRYLPINEVVENVSITHEFNKPELIFLNTSDVEAGKIINKKYMPISELKGQAKKTIKKDDILFSEIRPKNKRFAYIDFDETEDYIVSTKLMVLRNINPDVDTKYFYYFLTNDSMLQILQDRAENRICSFPQITFDLLSEYKIRVPEFNEQKHIASVLSTIDAKIEINRQINTELEAIAKTIYDYWFVQFDFPDSHGKPYKTSGGKMVWNEELKREVPEGWFHSNILAVADLFGGGTPSKKKEEYWGGEIPFFTPTDAGPDVFTLTTQDYITNQGLKKCSSPLFEEGTVFITARGSVGKLVIVANKMAMNQSCYALKAKRDISSSFLYYLSKDLIHHLQVKSSGSVFDSIVSNDIKNTYLAIPTDQVIRQFSKITEPIFNQILLNLKQNKVLSELRDWLLPMLMNGQVKVE